MSEHKLFESGGEHQQDHKATKAKRHHWEAKGRHGKAAAVVKGKLTAKSGSEKASLTGANMVMPWLVPFKLYCSPLLCSPVITKVVLSTTFLISNKTEHLDGHNMTADITTLGARLITPQQ